MSHGGGDSNSKITFTESFLISGIVAIISKTVSAPLERVKLLMQSQDELLKRNIINKKYDNVLECTTRTYKTEGFISFWRGNLANCIRYFPTQAITFAVKKELNAVQSLNVKKTDSNFKKLLKNLMSGGIAGSISLVFVYSLDYSRTRLGNDTPDENGQRKYKGLADVYKKTLQTDGIFGLIHFLNHLF